jgi:hypothetical protein
MKKIIVFVIMIILTSAAGYSQVFDKTSQAINIDLGFGHVDYPGEYYSGGFPSITASYEHGVAEIDMGAELTGVISVGGFLGSSMRYYNAYGAYDNDDWRETHFYIAARGNFHFIFHDKFDPYAGLMIGARIPTLTWLGDGDEPEEVDAKDPSPYAGIFIGGRWFFTDNIAVNAELGYLVSIFNVGVTFKF